VDYSKRRQARHFRDDCIGREGRKKEKGGFLSSETGSLSALMFDLVAGMIRAPDLTVSDSFS
jgi:hypothetical protein